MRFLIYGARAQAQALGCMFAADGHSVDLVLRQRFLPVSSKLGLRVTGIFGDFQADGDTFGLMTVISGSDGSEYHQYLSIILSGAGCTPGSWRNFTACRSKR